MSIIGITGKIGSGKSTIARILVEKYGYTEYSLAEPLKKIGEIFGFTQEQLYGTQEQKLQVHPFWGVSAREFLQKVGTELFRDRLREILPMGTGSVWCDIFRLKYTGEQKYVISDVRFLDEMEMIKSLRGIIIRTERDNMVKSKTGNELVHSSEVEMNQIRADYTIQNNKDFAHLENEIAKILT